MEFVDWDLWGPSYDLVAQDSSFYVQPGWQCDFYFGFGVDVIEENALNEKFCVQVLRILIKKADNEIDELEKDLVTLQSELAWAENEEWSELCCSTLREKINYLDISLKSLRNAEKYEIDVHLLMHREPAENVHEIVKALLQSQSPTKDEQPPDVIVKDSSADAAALAGSNVIEKEEVKEPIITSSEKSPISCSSLKFQEEKTYSLEAVKIQETLANSSAKNGAPDSLQFAAGYSKEDKVSHNNNSKLKTKNKAKSQGSTRKDNGTLQRSTLKPTKKPVGDKIKRSNSYALKHPVGNSKSKKKLRASDLKRVSKEVEVATVDAIILGSSLKPEGGELGLAIKVKLTNAIKDSGIDAPAIITCNPHEMEKSCYSILEVDGDKEFGEHCYAMKKSENLSSSLCCSEGNVYIPKAEMHTNAIKESGVDAPAHAAGNPHEMEKLCNLDLEVDGDKEVKKHCSAMKSSENSSSSSYCSEGDGYFPKTETCTNTVKDSGAGVHAYATGNSLEIKTLLRSDLEVDGDKEVGKQCSATKKSGNFSSSLCCSEGNEYFPETEMPAKAVVKNSDPHASRDAADYGGREQDSESRLDAFDLAKNGNPDVEQKLSDTALSPRASKEDDIEICMNNIIDLVSSLKTKRNSSDSPETDISNIKHLVLTSPLEPQDQMQKDTFKQQFEEGTPPGLTFQEAEIATNDCKFGLNMPQKPQKRQKVKRKIQSNPASVHEGSAIPTGFGLDLTTLKVKKRQKLELSTDNVCLNKLLDRKTFKKLAHPSQHEAKEQAVTTDISINSNVLLEKSCTVPTLVGFRSSTVDMDRSYSQLGEGTETVSKVDISCCIDNDCSKAKAATSSDLSGMKLVDLKAIARQYKVQHSKLKKEELVKQLTDVLGF